MNLVELFLDGAGSGFGYDEWDVGHDGCSWVDVLMFGRESVGLPRQVQEDPHVTERVRIPMLPGRRSLNLANSASIAVYEAWRQHGFGGVL